MIDFEVQKEDFLAASRFATRRKKGLLWFQVINSGILLCVGLFLTFSSAVPPGLKSLGALAFALVGFLWLVFFLGYFVLVPWQAQRHFATNIMARGSRTVSWNNQAITVNTPYGVNSIPWTHFSDYAENDKIILLYTSPRLMIFIPKHALSEAQAGELRVTFHAARAQPVTPADRPPATPAGGG